jgi:TRAP-type C4-dicarboxylate transport system permease large subunit
MFTVTAHSHGQAMYVTAGTALAAIAISYIAITLLGKKFKQNIPISINLFVSVAISAVVTGFGFPFRHLFEGPVWYIYINLVIFTGMMFLTCMKQAGNLDCIAYDILTRFRTKPAIMLCLITLLLFFPGMVTGVGTAAVLTTGMVAIVILRVCGIPNLKIAAILTMVTSIGAAAPPVNLPAIIIASGINMPYEGFDIILLVITVPLGLFSIFFLGYRDFKIPSLEAIEKALPKPERKSTLMPYVPLIVVVSIMALIRIFPGEFPDIVTPMVFIIGTFVAMFCGKKFHYVEACKEALRGGVFSTVALIFVVGAVVQVTTLTGAKGLLVLGAMVLGSMAPTIMYLVMGISLPLLGGVLTHLGASVILGIPFTLAMISSNQIAVVTGCSILCVLAQVIPPSALGGYFAQELTQEPSYLPVLKKSFVPLIVCIIFSMVELMFANQFAAWFVPF